MPCRSPRPSSLASLIILSVLAHLALLSLAGRVGVFELTPAVGAGKSICVDLSHCGGVTAVPRGIREGRSPRRAPVRRGKPAAEATAASVARDTTSEAARDLPAAPEPVEARPVQRLQAERMTEQEPLKPAAEPASPGPATGAGKSALQTAMSGHADGAEVSGARPKAGRVLKMPPPLRKGEEFVSSASETLSYRIRLHGFAIGEAELAAVNREGKVKITARLRSSPLVEAFYRVDDALETELIAGNYIVTTIRRHEGEYIGAAGFTIMLRERKAFTTDRLRGRFVTDALPSSEVTDPITGLYYLRNQPMKEGETLLLHLYDCGQYRETPVEVLHREWIQVPGLGKVRTLVIRPQFSRSGLFSKTGPLQIWLTDDRFRVPVRIKTRIALGEVTAEIVSLQTSR